MKRFAVRLLTCALCVILIAELSSALIIQSHSKQIQTSEEDTLELGIKNYFTALSPKLEIGGCFTAHNARNTGMEGIKEFIDYVTGLPNFKTNIDTTSRSGISISYKMAED